MMTEKMALGKVLEISRLAYSAICKGETELNYMALLDNLSAALSHVEHEKKPLRKCMRALKREIKTAGKPFYLSVKPKFSPVMPYMEYNYEKTVKHVPAIIYGNDRICAAMARGEREKVRSMADAMKSYPGFLCGEFEALSDEQFYDLVFGYYPKLYEEPFMDEMKSLFTR